MLEPPLVLSPVLCFQPRDSAACKTASKYGYHHLTADGDDGLDLSTPRGPYVHRSIPPSYDGFKSQPVTGNTAGSCSHPPLCTTHPEAGLPLLLPHPRKKAGHLGVLLQRFNGAEVLLQGGLAEQGVELAMAGGAEQYLRAMLASAGLGHEMVASEAAHLALA